MSARRFVTDETIDASARDGVMPTRKPPLEIEGGDRPGRPDCPVAWPRQSAPAG